MLDRVECRDGLIRGLFLNLNATNATSPVIPLQIKHNGISITDSVELVEKAGGSTESDFVEILVPGFCNPHTHLELSLFGGMLAPPPAGEFPAWAAGLWRLKEGAATDHGEAWGARAIKEGVRQSLEAGVTLIGDIVTQISALEEIAKSPIPTVAFCELIGPDPAKINESWERFAPLLARELPLPHKRGVSPHAPHTVSGKLFHQLKDNMGRPPLPVAIHTAETKAELELIGNGTGIFGEMFRGIGLGIDHWPEKPGESPVERLNRLGWLPAHVDSVGDLGGKTDFLGRVQNPLNKQDPKTLLIHGNYLTPNEAALLTNKDVAICWCPDTHEYFGHEAWPFERLAHLPIIIGTDSLASSWSLAPLKQLRRALRAQAGLTAARGLSAISLYARDALMGSNGLAPPPDFTLLQVDRTYLSHSPLDDVMLRSMILDESTRVAGTIIGGQWAWRIGA